MGMDPMTIGSLGMMALSVGSQVAGQMKADKQAKSASKARDERQDAMRKVAEANARRIQKQNMRALQSEQADYRRNAAGAQVGLAKAGVLPGTGSALELLSSVAGQHQRNLLDIREDGRIRRQEALDMGVGYGMPATSGADGGGNVFDTANSLLSLGAKAYGLYKGM